MAIINVSQFATELGLPPAMLLEQLQAAGLTKKLAEETLLTEQDKMQLLEHLQKVHGADSAKKKITVTRRQTTEIKKADSTGKARTIQVEVRRKRVFVKRVANEPVAESKAAAPEKTAASAPILDKSEIAARETEAKKQAELIARQSADARAKGGQKSKKEEPEAEPEPAEKKAVVRVRTMWPEGVKACLSRFGGVRLNKALSC